MLLLRTPGTVQLAPHHPLGMSGLLGPAGLSAPMSAGQSLAIAVDAAPGPAGYAALQPGVP